MILSKEQFEEFEELARPLLDFINATNPYCTILLTTTHADLLERTCTIETIED